MPTPAFLPTGRRRPCRARWISWGVILVLCGLSACQGERFSPPPQAGGASSPARQPQAVTLPFTWTPAPTSTPMPAPTRRPSPTPPAEATAYASLGPPSPTPTSTPWLLAAATPPADWLSYQSSRYGFALRYPKELSLHQQAQGLRLEHRLPYGHTNPCIAWGGPYCEPGGCLCTGQGCPDNRYLLYLVDFDVRIYTTAQPLDEAIQDLLPGGAPAGRQLQVGAWDGYRWDVGVEGCGETIFLQPVDAGHTLVVRRTWVSEFTAGDAALVSGLPGVILPAEAEALFYQLLGTLVKN